MQNARSYQVDAGMAAWLLHIVCGCGAIAYLFFCTLVVAAAALGKARFDGLMQSLLCPPWNYLETGAFFSLVFHCVNGIRVVFINAGIWIEDQKDMFYVALIMIVAVIVYHVLPYIGQFFQ